MQNVGRGDATKARAIQAVRAAAGVEWSGGNGGGRIVRRGCVTRSSVAIRQKRCEIGQTRAPPRNAAGGSGRRRGRSTLYLVLVVVLRWSLEVGREGEAKQEKEGEGRVLGDGRLHGTLEKNQAQERG